MQYIFEEKQFSTNKNGEKNHTYVCRLWFVPSLSLQMCRDLYQIGPLGADAPISPSPSSVFSLELERPMGPSPFVYS